jgi:hypothetical protein
MLKAKMQEYAHTQTRNDTRTYRCNCIHSVCAYVRGCECTCGSVMIDSGKPRLRMELTIKSVIDGKKVYNTAKRKVNMQTHKN